MSDDITELGHAIMELVDASFEKGDCTPMRFAVLLWHDRSEGPVYVGSNDVQLPRVLKVFKVASDRLLELDPAEGCA